MRYIPIIGSVVEYVEYKLNRPKYYPCPQCDKKGKRKRVIERSVKHIGPMHRPSMIQAKVGCIEPVVRVVNFSKQRFREFLIKVTIALPCVKR